MIKKTSSLYTKKINNLYIIFVFLFAFLFCGSLLAKTQEDVQPVLIQKDSPFEVYQSFTGATDRLEDDYNKYIADKSRTKLKFLLEDLRRIRNLLDLSEVPPANRIRVGDNSIAYLYDILARLPALNPETIPGYESYGETIKATDLPLRWTIPGTDIQIVRIEDGAHSGEYQFSSATIKNLENYHNAVMNLPILNKRNFHSFYLERSNATGYLIPHSFSKIFPEWLQTHYFNTPLWKISIITFINVILLVLSFFWIKLLFKPSTAKTGLSRISSFLLIPLGLLLFLYSSNFFVVTQINPVGDFANGIGLITSVSYYFILSWLIWLFIYFLAELLINFSKSRSKKHDESFFKLSTKLIAITAVFIILINGADQIGIPALGLLAGLGVGGIAVALASQSTIENIFGGLSIFVDRPFTVGDKILFNKQSAQVLRVGPRSTRLRTRDGALCTVPNSDLAKMHIVNFTLRNTFYINQAIELRHDSSSAAIRKLLVIIHNRVISEELIKKEDGWPRVRVVDTSKGRIVIRIQAILLSTDYNLFLSIQESIVLDVLLALEELELKMARNIYVED